MNSLDLLARRHRHTSRWRLLLPAKSLLNAVAQDFVNMAPLTVVVK